MYIKVEDMEKAVKERYPDNGEPGHDCIAKLLREAFMEGTFAFGNAVFTNEALDVLGMSKVGDFHIPIENPNGGYTPTDVEVWVRDKTKDTCIHPNKKEETE